MTQTSTSTAPSSSRRVRLRVAGCNLPPTACAFKGKFEVEIDLKKAFHHGYIDFHGRPPATGTNPLFDEYIPLLAPSQYLVWSSPGIAADDDSRSGESHRLGRALSRAYLEQHCGFSWFAHVSNLLKHADDGWTVKPKAKGDMPDWVIASASKAAIAEAKGTGRSISSSRIHKWRDQVRNIRVFKGGDEVSLDTYIVANRLVNSSQARTRPEIFVEDPPTDGREANDNDWPSLTVWAMRSHTYRNLLRLGQAALAERIISARNTEADSFQGTVPVVLWRCVIPALEGLRFIGRRVTSSTFPCELLSTLFEDIAFGTFRLRDLFLAAIQEWREHAFFDGVLLDSVKAGLFAVGARPFNTLDLVDLPDNVSLLGDGSLIAPASLMVIDTSIRI